eukprot:m.85067 g.85067  ORF g.85067 m.85067 type:complete len:184 (+) comp14412_c2_seq1:509-1060(+)
MATLPAHVAQILSRPAVQVIWDRLLVDFYREIRSGLTRLVRQFISALGRAWNTVVRFFKRCFNSIFRRGSSTSSSTSTRSSGINSTIVSSFQRAVDALPDEDPSGSALPPSYASLCNDLSTTERAQLAAACETFFDDQKQQVIASIRGPQSTGTTSANKNVGTPKTAKHPVAGMSPRRPRLHA